MTRTVRLPSVKTIQKARVRRRGGGEAWTAKQHIPHSPPAPPNRPRVARIRQPRLLARFQESPAVEDGRVGVVCRIEKDRLLGHADPVSELNVSAVEEGEGREGFAAGGLCV